MKKFLTIFVVLLILSTLGLQAQNDTMYVYKNGIVTFKSVTSEIDSIVFYKDTITLSLPSVITTVVSNITLTTAICGGNVTSDGGANVYGRGVCFSTSQNPTLDSSYTINGTGIGAFTSNLTGLNINTTYYVRAYAMNIIGTVYGNEVSFTTSTACGTISTINDTDNNIYNTVSIGTQCWINENLKTTKYNDGTAIPLVTDNTAWNNLSTNSGYCWYNNNQVTYGNTYGALYNWNTVNTGNLCPSGWHVPSDSEWTVLTDYIGGESIAGGKLKETGTTHWNSPNYGATNETNFTALPGGRRDMNGTFDMIGNFGQWWSSTSQSSTYSYLRYMDYQNTSVTSGGYLKFAGFSVRCVMDN
jgi:uncharacterized protein (TIGR02145 family)